MNCDQHRFLKFRCCPNTDHVAYEQEFRNSWDFTALVWLNFSCTLCGKHCNSLRAEKTFENSLTSHIFFCKLLHLFDKNVVTLKNEEQNDGTQEK